MLFKLFFLFAVVPVVELAILISVGQKIGVLNTVAVVILTAAVGAYMVRMEGLGVLYRIQKNLAEGAFPAEELIDGAMVLVAGALLLTPGFFTDVMGFLMVVPASRSVIKRWLRRYLEHRINITHGSF
jgi:UPF0716 protein FxsA